MANTTEHRRSNGSGSTAQRRGPREPRRGLSGWAPFASASTPDPEEDRYWLEREITLLERALEDRGEMRRRDLGDLVGCKYWGPGRFARALKAAVDQGRIKHTGFGRYGPAAANRASRRID
jgi:hypothetical protein